jgi:hypothetical protein
MKIVISEEIRVDLGIPFRSVDYPKSRFRNDFVTVDHRCLKRYLRRTKPGGSLGLETAMRSWKRDRL